MNLPRKIENCPYFCMYKVYVPCAVLYDVFLFFFHTFHISAKHDNFLLLLLYILLLGFHTKTVYHGKK